MLTKIKSILTSRIAILLYILIAVSALSYGLFSLLGLTTVAELQEFIKGAGYYAIIAFILIYILQTIFLQFIPGSGGVLILASLTVFGALGGAIIASMAIVLTSTIMYGIGRFIPEKGYIKLLNIKQHELDKTRELLNHKKVKIIYPLVMTIPPLPEDALCLVAGAGKMNFRYFMLATYIPRIIGVFSFIYIWSSFFKLTLFQMFILLNVIVVDGILIYQNRKKINHLFAKIGERVKPLLFKENKDEIQRL